MKKLKWGILGCGKIATIFSTPLRQSIMQRYTVLHQDPPQEMEHSGKAFSEQFNCCVCYDSFDQLLQDDHIGIIYIALPHKVNGYEYQAQAVTDAILSGKTWCDEMTLVDSLNVVTIMDQLRNDWGLVYPMENP